MSTPKERGRKPLRYLLMDFPSDHEIDGNNATECQSIAALLSNRALNTRFRHFRLSSLESFDRLPYYAYDPKFVHVACHGSQNGIGLIDGIVPWDKFAKHLKKVLLPLEEQHTRVMALSCCYSTFGAAALGASLSGYFTGIYHFKSPKISFADAQATWAMFYLKKQLTKPHEKIRDRINDSFRHSVLGYQCV
jgi:hypothetical protein